MLRAVCRAITVHRQPGGAGDSMVDEAPCHQAACLPLIVPAAVSDQAAQASSLITSCARKQAEKRRADSQGAQTQQQAKRSRSQDAVGQGHDQDQDDGCTSDISIGDQENLQQQAALRQQHSHQQQRQLLLQPQPAPQHPIVRAACSSLGHMLAPFIGWVPSPAQQQQQHDQELLELQQQQQQQEKLLLDEDACAWSDETAAGACSEEGLNNNSLSLSLSTSSAPTASQQPSCAGTAGHSSQSPGSAQQQRLYLLHQQQQQQQEGGCDEGQEGTLQPQPATCSVEGTAVTSAANTASDDSDEVDYDDDDFCPFTFISSLGPVERYVAPGRQPLLPRQTRACKQKTLVLDLDETLVHSTLDAGYGAGADFSFPVLFNGAEHMVHVRMRPHMQSFLERVATMFEVVVFTASQKVYAEKLLNILDPQRTLIRHRIYRDSCVVVEGNYLKDLSVLGRDLCRCAIVDNSPQAFGFQLSNGIPIESWYDDPTDTELPALLPFLEGLAAAEVHDVRPVIQAKFNLGARVAEANTRLAAAAAAAIRQQREQHAAALMAQVASAAAEVMQTQSQLPGMAMQMMMQQPQQAQEQAA